MNIILCPGKSYSKTYGSEPRYNDTPIHVVRFRRRRFSVLFLYACTDITATRLAREYAATASYSVSVFFKIFSSFSGEFWKVFFLFFSKSFFFFAKGDHHFWLLFQKTRECEDGMTSLLWIIREQNTLNTFHVFRYQNSVSIERLFRLFLFRKRANRTHP